VTRIRTEPLNLLRLTAESSLDTFIATFEAQLSIATVPEANWKLELIGQPDECHRTPIFDHISDTDSSYVDIIQGLRKASGETSSSIFKKYYSAEPDFSGFVDTTKALRVVSQWAKNITEGLPELLNGRQKFGMK